MNQSTLSLDRPLKTHRKTTQNLDVKKKELEHLQKQLEEKSKALENKEKELNAREMVLNKASTKGKKPKEKESNGVIKNNITISNISGPDRNTDVHYEDQNQLKKMRRESKESKEKKDEEPEKGYDPIHCPCGLLRRVFSFKKRIFLKVVLFKAGAAHASLWLPY